MDRKELISIRLNLIQKNYPVEKKPTLVAVTKKRPAEDILFAYEAGQRDFGENRVDELWEKSQALCAQELSGVCWHFIGHLQSNKINRLLEVPNLGFIHSVDSFDLLEKLYKRASVLTREVCFFLQVNTSGEKEKSGFQSEEELMRVANLIGAHEGSKLCLHGLMTMSKIRTDDFARDAKECFKKLKQIRSRLERDFDLPQLKLSMGMSSDYEWAIEEGSDYIRLGSALFRPEQEHN